MKNKLKMMRDYMAERRAHPHRIMCRCGRGRAVRVCGHEGICAKCANVKTSTFIPRIVHLTRQETEDEPVRGEKYWLHKLDFWLPNPTPGWGSLAVLERMLLATETQRALR